MSEQLKNEDSDSSQQPPKCKDINSLSIKIPQKEEGNKTSVKEWLIDKKIFFETIAVVLLAIMAIIVSFAQLYISQKQTDLLSSQLSIVRQQALPQFVMVAEQLLNDDRTQATDEIILVYNEGSLAYSIDVHTAVFFELTYYSQDKPNDDNEFVVPITGYYSVIKHMGFKNLVIQIEGNSNNSRLSKIKMDFRELGSKKSAFVTLELQQYIKITYRDSFNEQHIEYFDVPLISGAYRLKTSEGEAIFQKYDSNIPKLDFDKLDASQLYKIVVPSDQQ